ncbi:ISL3 family transposase [Tepidibacter formicigenes]|jgi:transposase|uniref:Zinc-finger of transposase IS204/IS1001/IS1096/IS1165 n=1 Tax=Tepidibacter formicigenes DSM 15518 TaxID=1123349 RepID=A0A1M6SCY6_9FIRM|nr:ISL3 family transposase [Tepidibacter formicigenes]SHK42529.1 zinc-finger of transposase IS204/IS1001/IS1096/IS1165 [Tepidibacter formicigenes DSM 15518]
MDEFIKLLDRNLEYVSHEIIDDTIYINVISTREEITCPYCGESSSKVHSRYKRSFQDLPMQEKKVKIILNNRKMFCKNTDCQYTTFAESFDFLTFKSKKTKRLDDKIINISMNLSSLTATNFLRNSVASIGKSTICNLLKKKRYQ